MKVKKAVKSLLATGILLIGSILLAVVAVASPQTAAKISVEAFAALPSFINPKLSPSGNFVGYLTSENGHTLFIASPLGQGAAIAIPPQPKSEIQTYYWINDSIVLLQLVTVTNRLIFGGEATTETRLVAYDLNTQRAKWLGKPEKDIGLSSHGREFASQRERLLDKLPNDPNHVLLQLNVQASRQAAVYKVNVYTGRRYVQKTGNDGVYNWFTDSSSVVRLGTGVKGDKQLPFATIRDGEGKWRNLSKLDWYNKYDIVTFSPNPNVVYVAGPTSFGTKGFFTLNLETGQIEQTLFARKNVDLDSVYIDSISGQPIGFSYGSNANGIEYFEPHYSALKDKLDNTSPNTRNTILSRSKNGRYLIRIDDSTNPGTYYIFDQNSGKLSALAKRRDLIDSALMAPTKPVIIPVRDGSTIPGYLTIPTAANSPIPFILLPHGGPQGHDTARWNFWTQFYASRGYGVLQPNFRGSTGYGEAFMQAGENQWGGLMQDDLTDATTWLIDEGHADSKRICIVGASYGGYAALMGAIKEPALYKCAISVNGVTNLPELKSEDQRFVGARNWIKTMGLKGFKDQQVSPYHRANEINIPVLLMSSKDDARIPWKMSENMHKRLKKLKKNSKYIKIKDGTHNMITAQSRLAMLKATEKFLAKHIGD